MRETHEIEQARESMEARIERDSHPICLLTWQAKRDTLGAVLNGNDIEDAEQNLEDALAHAEDLDLPSFVRIQAARNVFAWVRDERDTI